MKVGDLVISPGAYRDQGGAIGLVLQTQSDGINRGTPYLRRVRVYWIQDGDTCWEPVKWLEVISEK